MVRMHFAEDDLQKFMNIWEAEFGERLSATDATIIAERLLRLYDVLARPLPKSERNDDQAASFEVGA